MQHTWAPTRVRSTYCAQPSVLGTHSKCFESKILHTKTINLIIELELTFGVFALFEDEYCQDDYQGRLNKIGALDNKLK